MKEAAKGIHTFLSPAFSAEHSQLLAKWHAELASIVGKIRKPVGRGSRESTLLEYPKFDSPKPKKKQMSYS
jgi:hypothetical protein